MKNAPNKHGTTTIDCEVSFKVSKMDYGTIMVPKGTKVTGLPSGGDGTTWFIDDYRALCPAGSLIDGKPSEFFCHDAKHYGITIPPQNVTCI